MYNIYKEAKSCVKLDNTLSDFFSCNIGVRQGENLSPLLFALFLNDFNTCISTKFHGLQMFTADNNLYNVNIDNELKLFSLLYADDTVILAESAHELQNVLNAAHEYCIKYEVCSKHI